MGKKKNTKYYAVKVGHKPGIYKSTKEALDQIRGFSGGVMKMFYNIKDAESFMEEKNDETPGKKQKYYVVTAGHKTGIYLTSQEAVEQTKGFKGAKMKMFKNEKDAYAYLNDETQSTKEEENDEDLEVQDTVVKSVMANHVFVDGSFNTKTKTYGYGGILFCNKGVYTFKGKGQDKRFQALGSLSGELLAATEAIKLAIDIGLEEITILYDCEAIELYSQRKPKGNAAQSHYKNFIDSNKNSLRIYFKKVKAHSGIEGNEMADILAKSASGAKLSKTEKKYLQMVESISTRL